jgi:lysozyme
MQSRNPNNARGIDVSHHQGDIDWLKVKADHIDFAFVKATEGLGYIDDKFRRNAAGANAVGIPVGYYHYAHPEMNKAVDEAAAFLDAVKSQPSQLPYILDLEGSEAAALDTTTLTKWAVDFMNTVHTRAGKPVMLYTGAYFARDELNKSLGFVPLWIAHYGAATPLANGTWNDWTFFQYTSTGSVKGIVGNVDMNEYNGSVSELMGYQMKPEDANKVIEFLRAGYNFVNDPESHAEFKRIANELRKVSGQPIQ